MAKPCNKLSCEWIKRTIVDFRTFLETKFPDPTREEGSRGPEYKYPEWLIMFIAILAVKCKRKSYGPFKRWLPNTGLRLPRA